MQNTGINPGSSFIFRKAENEDQFEIYILVETVLSGFGLSKDPEETDKNLLYLDESYFNNNGWFEVIVNPEKKIIGSYGLSKINDNSCELIKMYLYPEFLGMGPSKKMMNNALLKAKELGYKEIILETNKLLVQAIGLYKKYGFKEFESGHCLNAATFL